MRKLRHLVFMLCSGILLSACASSMHQLASAEHEAVQQGKKAVVLFRVTATLDDKEIAPLVEDEKLFPLQLGLANLAV